MTDSRPLPRGPAPGAAAESEAEASAILTIDLDALSENYRTLAERAGPAECGAVVKADAYGLGMAEIAPALWRAGCRTFFVATLGEAHALRELLPEATIYVFNGLFEGTAPLFHRHDLRPVLNSADEIAEWADYCEQARARLAAAVHIDSGMNRLGLSAAEVETVAAAQQLWSAFELVLVMSHLACADDPAQPKNAVQRDLFDRLRRKLPEAPASLANSAGILLGSDYAYDLVRPGIALYGGHPRRKGENPFRHVVRLDGRIVQVRDAEAGETTGYGATRTLRRTSRIAIVAAGYADGLFRLLSAGDGVEGLSVFVGPQAAPLLGRVSMDLITIDVTGIPAHLARRGAWVELIGPNITAQTHAARVGTIDYEVLTNLGPRAFRRYIGA